MSAEAGEKTKATRKSREIALPEPILMSAAAAAAICGLAEPTWWRHHSAEMVPAPIMLGGRTLWDRRELERWIDAKCPPRGDWEAAEKRRRAEERVPSRN